MFCFVTVLSGNGTERTFTHVFVKWANLHHEVTLTKHTVLFSIVTCPQITSCYSPEPNISLFRGLCAVFEKKKKDRRKEE